MARRLNTGIAPDLAGVHATALSVIVELPEIAFNALLQTLALEPGRAVETRFVSNYSRARKKHQAYGHFIRQRGTESPRAIHMLYDLEPVEFEGDTRTIVDLLEALTEVQVQSEARCSAEFEYPDDEWASVIKLPWQPLDMEGLPFDEFRGFRAAKLRDADVLYSIIVDRPTNREITHALSFSYPATLDEQLPATLLARATEISRLFVTSRATPERPGRGSQ